MSNKWKKRSAKVKGILNQAYSSLLLRHTRINRRALMASIQKKSIDRLHVGCGNVYLPGWLNIYFERREEYGRLRQMKGTFLLNYNLLQTWPVAPESIQFVAGSHFIEHLDLNHGIKFLKEAYRVMRKGATIRLSCPDLEIYARNYVNNNEKFFENPLIREWCTFQNAKTPGEIFIAKAYDSGHSHQWFYDFTSLKHILELTGFKNVKKCKRLEGTVPDLALIELPERELETLYVEATKA